MSPEYEVMLQGLSFLYSECSRHSVESTDFNIILVDLNFEEKIMSVVSQVYKDNLEQLRKMFQRKKMENFQAIPKYKSLDWRLDVEIDRKNIRRLANPLYTMLLETTDEQHPIVMNVTYQDLKHCCETLKEALKEVNLVHSRRIKQHF